MKVLKSILSSIWGFTSTFGLAIALALLIRAMVVEPYRIPSGSMLPTLEIGDFLFVNKFAYNIKIPFMEVYFKQTPPKHGDIVVFKRENTGLPGSFFGFGPTFLIKRVVALPGDEISYVGKRLFVNGQPAEMMPQGTYTYQTQYGQMVDSQRYTQAVAGFQHDVLVVPLVPGQNLVTQTVPADKYVVIGDNRDNSRDGRFWKYPNWGYVDQTDLAGRAEFIFFSLGEGFSPRWRRIFNGLHPTRPRGELQPVLEENAS